MKFNKTPELLGLAITVAAVLVLAALVLAGIKRATAGLGWGLLAGGSAALFGGVAILIWGRDEPTEAAISLGPGTVSFLGHF